MGPRLPAPAPTVGALRATRPRWPRYCFTFQGVYFSLIVKKRDRGRRESGAPLSAAGARSPRARPARGGVSGPTPSGAGAGPLPTPHCPLPTSLSGAPRLPSLQPSPGAARAPAEPDLARGPLPPRASVRPLVRPGARLRGRAASSSPATAPAAALRPLPSPRPSSSSPARCTRLG